MGATGTAGLLSFLREHNERLLETGVSHPYSLLIGSHWRVHTLVLAVLQEEGMQCLGFRGCRRHTV